MSPGIHFIRFKRSPRNVIVKRGISAAGFANAIRDNAYTTWIAATALIKRMNVGNAYKRSCILP